MTSSSTLTGPRPARHASRPLPWCSSSSDEALLVAARHGDDQAYGELYRRYVGEIRRYARSLVAVDDVDDLISESFTKVLHALRRSRGPVDNPIRYLMVTTKTSAISIRERRRRQDDVRERVARQTRPLEELLLDADEELIAAFASLSPRWRSVLWLSVVEGHTPGEIGDRMGLNAGAVSTLVYRAKRALRTAYFEQLEGQPA